MIREYKKRPIYTGGGQNNGHTKKLRNRICVSYSERNSDGNTECSSVCLHSVVLVSVQKRLCWVTARVNESENGRPVQFSMRVDRWHAFSWSICDKNCHIIRCVGSESFWGYVGIHESCENNIGEKEEWDENQQNSERSLYIGKGCFENHRTTAA
jgi:hypothetical protein